MMIGPAHAESRRVLVLPLDGNATPGLRARLNATIEQLARTTSERVTIGGTTFSETALAVGCAPDDNGCAETVRATLGVDVLVHGTVSEGPLETTLVVHRTAARERTSSTTAVLPTGEPPESLEAQLAPWFGGPPPGEPSGAPPDEPEPDIEMAPAIVEPTRPPINRERSKGFLIASSGGLSLAIGLALWSHKASIQRDIDDAPTRDADDFERLESLEGRAMTYAMVGNLMVAGGLALAAWGSWIVYKDHKSRQVTVTPSVSSSSAGVSIGGVW
jgi:hypothetical protein